MVYSGSGVACSKVWGRTVDYYIDWFPECTAKWKKIQSVKEYTALCEIKYVCAKYTCAICVEVILNG